KGAEKLRDVVNAFGLRVAMLLAFDFRFLLRLVGKRFVQIDLGKFADQIREDERIGLVRIQERAALLGKIGLIRFLVDREKQFFLQCEEFLFARVLVKRELGLVHRLALLGIFHHAQELFVARLAEFHFEKHQAALFVLALLEKFLRVAREAIAKHVLLAHKLVDERFPLVVLVRRHGARSADDERRARLVDQNGIHFI